MPREIDERKKRKALNRVRRAKEAAERAIANCPDAETAEAARRDLSEWEEEFVVSLEQRLATYGSAFADPDKGDLEEPLSRLQAMKLKEIEKKAKGKAPTGFKRGSSFKSKGSGFARKTGPARSNTREIHSDIDEPVEEARESPVSAESAPAPASGFKPRVIETGAASGTGAEDRPAREGPAQRPASPFKVIEGGRGE